MAMPKILYVDDEAINLELLQLTFMNEFQVITAESAKEGLKLLALNPDIQLVISDLKMPGLDGIGLLKRIKEHYSDVSVIIATSFGTVETAYLVLDKKTRESKGYGFVVMSTEAEAQKAIKALDGKKVGDYTVKVQETKPKD